MGMSADFLQVDPSNASPVPPGVPGLYAGGNPARLRFVDGDGTAIDAGDARALRKSVGAPSGVQPGWVWYDSSGAGGAGAAYLRLQNLTLQIGGGGGPIAASQITSGLVALARGGTGADLSSATQNYVFAGPAAGGNGAALLRALVAADIPDLSTVYVIKARTLTAGAGLTGGGDLSTNRTIALAALSPSPAGTFASPSSITLNDKGQVTSVTAGGGGGSGSTWRYDPAARAAALQIGPSAGDYTVGWTFLLYRAGQVRGVRHYWGGAATTIRYTLWDGGGSAVRVKDVPVSGPGLVSAIFESPYDITLPINQNAPLVVSAYDLSGAQYTGAIGDLAAPSGPLPDGLAALLSPVYTNGNAYPGSQTGWTNRYPLRPIFDGET